MAQINFYIGYEPLSITVSCDISLTTPADHIAYNKTIIHIGIYLSNLLKTPVPNKTEVCRRRLRFPHI